MEDELGIGAIIASFGLFLIYHIVVVVALYYPQYLHIPLANNIENAVVWITKHKERDDANSGTLAVQTLRNAILAAVFIGGYAFQNGVSSLNSFRTSTLSLSGRIAALHVASLMFLSFLSWATVIRCASHLGFQIGVVSYLTTLQPNASAPSSTQNGNIDAPSPQLTNWQPEIERKLAYCNKLICRLMQFFT
jgi:hypothetical protein